MLLFLKASPRHRDSKSIQIAESYLSALRGNNPDLKVDTIELWDADLPQFDGNKVAAKMNAITGLPAENERPSNVVDLMEALRRSVQGGGNRTSSSKTVASHKASAKKRTSKRAA